MEVKIDKSFQKDTRKVKDKLLLKKIVLVISEVQKAENINEIKNLKKLKGSSENYRIKIGDYRLGIIISESTFEFIRCLHRKDIYKYFPK
jgi:mRNA interferase RelE/StbE